MEIMQVEDLQKKEQILQRLKRFNAENNTVLAKNGIYEQKGFSFFAVDEDKLLGGATCYSEYDWLYIDYLFVDENLRGKSIGSKLIAEIEEFAKENKFTGIFLDTFDFQARPFYEKNGFVLSGVIENMPLGSKRYTLIKQI